MEAIIEVIRHIPQSQEQVKSCAMKQNVDAQMQEKVVDDMKVVPQERVQQRTEEWNINVPMSQSAEEFVESCACHSPRACLEAMDGVISRVGHVEVPAFSGGGERHASSDGSESGTG